MAIKLSKAERAELTVLADEAAAARAAVEDALVDYTTTVDDLNAAMQDHINQYNEDLTRAFDALITAITPFNEALAHLRERVQDYAIEWTGEWSDKSEKWQDGDAGQAARSFIEAWESAGESLEDVVPEPPDGIDPELASPGLDLELPAPDEVINELPDDPDDV